MHLLKAQPGVIADGSQALDLGQSPGDIVFLSAADTELASLAKARQAIGDSYPSLRLANLMQLSHNASVDLYVEQVIEHAKLVVVRLLGGRSYWTYGVEQLVETCRRYSIPLAIVPGDDQPDSDLLSLSSIRHEDYHRLWQYLVHGGLDNSQHFLALGASLIGRAFDWAEPVELPKAGIYWPGERVASLDDLKAHWFDDKPVAAIVFYRALVQADNLAPIDALITSLREQGVNALPVYCSSLKEPVSAAIVETLLSEAPASIVLNITGFSVSTPGQARVRSPLNVTDAPVLQVVCSGGSEPDWRETTRGLSARDIAMNVALPEVDGRILSRAISFKGEAQTDRATQCPLVVYQPLLDRVEFVAQLAHRWLRLRCSAPAARRIAVVMANYPNRDGRLGNGVGLDTPKSIVRFLQSLKAGGYQADGAPTDGDELVRQIQAGPTNAAVSGRTIRHVFALSQYQVAFARLPADVRRSISERWGEPSADPFFVAPRNGFAMPAIQCGHITLGLQPARGYNIDPKSTYHDPDLVPPHGYLAFYFWLREEVDVHAIVHMGKHGNLEWLPGKALALSQECFPEAVLGPMPHIYPFIVNDPGEGTQAKRRSQAVIVDHLTPPLTRAETYGPLAELELLIDEYFEAAGVDPRRLVVLRKDILSLAGHVGLDSDCGIDADDGEDEALSKLDNYLCELKETQIRGGLHEFGLSPCDEQRLDLLIALTRLPRGDGKAQNQSLIRALSKDLGLVDFDPLDCNLGETWSGPCPAVLANETSWRTIGDTVERLEDLAKRLVAGDMQAKAEWHDTKLVLSYVDDELSTHVDACGELELAGIHTALGGRFLEPGPSGAPTRGRNDVLPTGRNFYSVDTRTVPTPAAWQLGWKSAGLILERYRQDNGEWPQSLALSAWGTANMRTGGDDIAQALALMGVQPTWEIASRRVTGFEVMPLDILDRPRVDVTLRVSGFFRDAFPSQIDLVDSAARAVAALDEPQHLNPLAARYKNDRKTLMAEGVSNTEASRRAGYRVFGSKPGAYGAGLQALIDEGGWESGADFASAYIAWGGYAYGNGSHGAPAHALFEKRLGSVQAVLHNQDNREHDILDSDDYYQFEGGLTATIKHLTGDTPSVYHNDHSRPERPRVQSLKEEIARVVRARVVNPKWIDAMRSHGYKGAFELAATVDYMFAFAATTGMVEDHHFDAVYSAFLEDETVVDFMDESNPAALREMCARLIEAQERGLWRPRSNSAAARLRQFVQ